MALDLGGKYTVLPEELGKGAWSVVRTCKPIPPYEPPAFVDQPLFAGAPPVADSDRETGATAAAAPMGLVAKVISKEHVKSLSGGNAERARSDVMREIDTLRVLPPHPNVARFVEHLEDDENYYIIFEAAPGGDLCDLILKNPDSRIDEQQAKQFTAEIIRAVLHCHRHGTAHRDIKPENLLVGHGNVLKLTDFGLAKVLKPAPPPPAPSSTSQVTNDVENPHATQGLPSPTTQKERRQYDFLAAGAQDPVLAAMHPSRLWTDSDGSIRPDSALAAGTSTNKGPVSAPAVAPYCPGHEIVGTLRYGAPEMFQAKFERGTFDAFQADSWSVGVVVYIMLTGNFPFSAGSNATERETFKVLQDTAVNPPSFLSAAAQDFLLRLLNKNPERRITLADALDHRWVRPVVERNDRIARNVFRLRRTEPSAEPTTITAPPPVAVPPAVSRLRNLISGAADKLPSDQSEILRAAFDDVVATFDVQATATGRLREALLTEQSKKAAAAAGSTSARSGVTSTIRRGVVSPAPSGTRGRSGSNQRDPSGSRPTTPIGTRRPPSPAVRRPVAATSSGGRSATPTGRAGTPTGRAGTPTGRVPSPGRLGVSPGARPPGTTSTSATAVRQPVATRPGAVTPTRRASPLAPPSSSTSGIATRRPVATSATGARRTDSPAAKPVTPMGSGTTRTSSASRLAGGTTTAGSGSARSTGSAAVRNSSPLARASPVARRGTPLRTGASPAAVAAGGAARRAPPAPPTTGSSSAALPAVGDTATYKGSKAVVRFVGETGFAAGQWVGLEMVEGGEGIHDGTSAVDKKRYFTCPAQRGIFVRPSQVHSIA